MSEREFFSGQFNPNEDDDANDDPEGLQGLSDSWASDPTLNPSSEGTFPDAPLITQSQPPSVPSGGGFNFDNFLVSVTNTALAAIRLNTAWKQSKDPNIRTVTVAGGFTKTPGADGYLTVTDSSGRMVGREKPTPGTPYALPSGQTIINNGNDTYALITPGGVTVNKSYGSAGAGGGFDLGEGLASPLIIGLGVIGALLFFQSQSRRSR